MLRRYETLVYKIPGKIHHQRFALYEYQLDTIEHWFEPIIEQ
ncbi:hypothetical protein [Legionella hackeliae]|nr:hypothetical protein [Legionella hackeliae]